MLCLLISASRRRLSGVRSTTLRDVRRQPALDVAQAGRFRFRSEWRQSSRRPQPVACQRRALRDAVDAADDVISRRFRFHRWRHTSQDVAPLSTSGLRASGRPALLHDVRRESNYRRWDTRASSDHVTSTVTSTTDNGGKTTRSNKHVKFDLLT